MGTYRVFYGKENIEIELDEKNVIACLAPKAMEACGNELDIIRKAMEEPIGTLPLKDLAKPGQKVAIIVDDITRPTPTQKLLPLILKELKEAGVEEQSISIIFANGSHRMHTREEQAFLIGSDVLDRYKVADHNPHDLSGLTYLGRTPRGTPVHINRFVAEADLKILTGLIKPHCVAGYSGGGKSILPGVSSLETIIADHNYQATSHHRSVFGVMDGNPIRSDIEDAAHLVGPCFILNVILDRNKRIVDAVAGDMIKAHRAGAQKLDQLVRVSVEEEADIIIAGCSYPMSANLYQSANAALACTRIHKPVIKRGGIIILTSPCNEGIGGGPFYELVREAKTPQEVLMKISRPGFFVHDQWAAQLWASVLTYCEVFLVCEGISPGDVCDMKARPFASVRSALQEALDKKGEAARVLLLPDAPYTIPELQAAKGERN